MSNIGDIRRPLGGASRSGNLCHIVQYADVLDSLECTFFLLFSTVFALKFSSWNIRTFSSYLLRPLTHFSPPTVLPQPSPYSVPVIACPPPVLPKFSNSNLFTPQPQHPQSHQTSEAAFHKWPVITARFGGTTNAGNKSHACRSAIEPQVLRKIARWTVQKNI